MKNKSNIQKIINSSKNKSNAQGTIEYLVIIAIVVVIALVVVALLLGIFESNSDVGTTAQNISTQTLPVALNEAILGVGDDANGLIVLTNNTGSIIRDVRVLIDGKDHNYFGINVAQGNKVTFKLNSLQIPCPSGQDKVVKNITILYTTKNGLEQKQILENITLQCTQNPTSTVTPIQENQEGQTPSVDTSGPQIIILMPENNSNFSISDGQIDFEYTITDNSGIIDCNLLIDDESIDYSDEINETESNYFYYFFDESEVEIGTQTATISCKDTLNNEDTNTITFNFTDTDGPFISIESPVDEETFTIGEEIQFEYLTSDPNGVTDCNLLINSVSVDYSEYIDEENLNYFLYSTSELEADEYTANITCKDTQGNINTAITQITFTLIDPGPCPGETELYGECYSNVVAYWPMNETSGTNAIDYAGFDNNGTISGATINQTGKVEKAYSFDGSNDVISLNNSTELNFSDAPFTIMAWVKSNDLTWSGQPSILESEDDLGYKFMIHDSTGALNFGKVGGSEVYSSDKLTTKDWYHVAVVYNTNDTVTFYINGKADSGGAKLFSNTYSSGLTYKIGGARGQYWDGLLDEIIVFDRALSSTDVNDLFYASEGTLVDQLRVGLVGYWPLNEISGTTAIDYAGFDNNGTITGSPSMGQTGKVGNAYSFNGTGSQYVSIGMTGFPTESSSRTSCVWENMSSGGTNTNGSRSIFGYGANSSRRAYSMWHHLSNSNRLGGGFSYYDPVTSSGYTGWTYFCITYENSGQYVKLYANGALDGTTTTYALNTSNNGTAYIGKLPYDSFNATYGLVDEVAIWNRVLSPTEINNLYNNNSGIDLIP